jgi:nucleoside-diphosphate-sugar epimerase
MAVLITGGAGFIGLALAECLLAQGERVVLFDRAAPPPELLARLGRSCEAGAAALALVLGDIRSPDDVDAALSMPGVDRVVHAAAITSDAAREAREPLPVVDVNIGGTVNLLQRCALAVQARGMVLRRVLVLSSVAVYGITPPPGERYEEATAHPAPAALYGITKLASEQVALRLADLYKLDLRIARLGPVYGPWEYATGVRDALSPHAQVLAAALAGQGVVLPRSMRADWLYSRDAAAALSLLATRADLHHAVYNVGGQTMSDLPQWCELLASLTAHRLLPAWQWRLAGSGDVATVRYGLPVDRAALDIARLQSDTGWSPSRSLSAAAADQLAWQCADGAAFASTSLTNESKHGTS